MFGGLLLLSASFVALMTSVVVSAREAQASKPLPTVSASALPKQAQDMIALIRQGGPFRYKQDGVTFGNREKRLPAQHGLGDPGGATGKDDRNDAGDIA